MREDRLAEQLLDSLANHLLRLENLTPLVESVWRELDAFLNRLRRDGPGENFTRLERLKVEKQAKIRRLINYITETDRPSESVRAALAEEEAEVTRIDEQLRTSAVPTDMVVTKQNLEGVVVRAIENLQEVLNGDAIRARQLIQHHIKRLVLFPGEDESGAIFEVLGEMDLFSIPDDVDECVLLDHGSTAMVQQHTSDHFFRFAGLQLHVRKDLGDHPLVDMFQQLFEANPELARDGRNAKEWSELLLRVVPPNSQLYSRINFMYVTQAFVVNRELFERRFALNRAVNKHTGKIFWSLKPSPNVSEVDMPNSLGSANAGADPGRWPVAILPLSDDS